jgi:putative ABC transport system ATP-binding protein
MLRAEEIRKSFHVPGRSSDVEVLNGISLTISAGVTAIVGPSGSGKSTLLYCLAGLERPTSGRAVLLGQDLTSISARRLALMYREQIGFVFQSFNLIPSLTAWENVALPQRLGGKRVDKDLVDEALTQVDLLGHAHDRPGTLSGGEQQRVAIARALANQPEILFADEPTGALDSRSASRVNGYMRTVADRGGAVLFVTHDISAACTADQVVVIRDGGLLVTLSSPEPVDILDALAAPYSPTTTP